MEWASKSVDKDGGPEYSLFSGDEGQSLKLIYEQFSFFGDRTLTFADTDSVVMLIYSAQETRHMHVYHLASSSLLT